MKYNSAFVWKQIEESVAGNSCQNRLHDDDCSWDCGRRFLICFGKTTTWRFLFAGSYSQMHPGPRNNAQFSRTHESLSVGGKDGVIWTATTASETTALFYWTRRSQQTADPVHNFPSIQVPRQIQPSHSVFPCHLQHHLSKGREKESISTDHQPSDQTCLHSIHCMFCIFKHHFLFSCVNSHSFPLILFSVSVDPFSPFAEPFARRFNDFLDSNSFLTWTMDVKAYSEIFSLVLRHIFTSWLSLSLSCCLWLTLWVDCALNLLLSTFCCKSFD